MERENFRSRLGFILVSAGCAIGIGNVWRFPFITGENGGGIFVLFYLLFLVCMGIPVLTMELAVGRAGRSSTLLAYKRLEKPGQKWHIHGWFCLIGCYILMMYYTTVSGWMLSYFYKFAVGTFASGMDSDAVARVFESLLAGCMDNLGWSRKKASFINCIIVLVTSIPCVLGYNLWSHVHLIGGRDILDTEDFLVSNLLLPLGSLIFLLFCVTRWGWGFDQYTDEVNTGTGIKLPRALKWYFQWILPVLILIILGQGLIG